MELNKLNPKKVLSKNIFLLVAIFDILLILSLASYFGWTIYNNLIKIKPLDEAQIESKQIGIDEAKYENVISKLKDRRASQLKIDPASINNPFLP